MKLKYFIALLLELVGFEAAALPVYQNYFTTSAPANLTSGTAVYYFDPLANNIISQPNNPMAPYPLLDDINTANLTTPAVFVLAQGIYYFTNSITNASVIGSGESTTILVDGNVQGALDEQSASAFTVFTNNLTFKDFTVGFADGGIADATLYNSIWYIPTYATVESNNVVLNINYPISLPFGLSGGSSLDGWIDASAATPVWQFSNLSGDVTWDWFVKNGAAGNINMQWFNCNLITEALVTSQNTTGAGHFWFDNSTENNAVYIWSGCKLRSNGTVSPNLIQITSANLTNCSITVQGSTITTANQTNDFYLKAKPTSTSLSMYVTGSIMDSNYLSLSATLLSSPVWYSNIYTSFIDQSGNSYTSGIMNGNGGVRSSVGAAVHIPAAVTVGASVFNFINPNPNAVEVYLTDAAAYSVTKNGVSVFGSLAGDCYLVLQPTNAIAITYLSTAPTMTTNAW